MKDITLQRNRDIAASNGDFVISDAQQQSLELLLISEQGEWKAHPEAGCGIMQAQNGTISRQLDRRIRVQLEADNFHIEKLTITEKGIDINGQYQ